jgi:hypothetical protein
MKERNLLVDTLVELAPEELDPHDGEDEPEHEAHQQHVEDGGDGVHQRIHHNLKRSSLNAVLQIRFRIDLALLVPDKN